MGFAQNLHADPQCHCPPSWAPGPCSHPLAPLGVLWQGDTGGTHPGDTEVSPWGSCCSRAWARWSQRSLTLSHSITLRSSGARQPRGHRGATGLWPGDVWGTSTQVWPTGGWGHCAGEQGQGWERSQAGFHGPFQLQPRAGQDQCPHTPRQSRMSVPMEDKDLCSLQDPCLVSMGDSWVWAGAAAGLGHPSPCPRDGEGVTGVLGTTGTPVALLYWGTFTWGIQQCGAGGWSCPWCLWPWLSLSALSHSALWCSLLCHPTELHLAVLHLLHPLLPLRAAPCGTPWYPKFFISCLQLSPSHSTPFFSIP